MKAQQKKLSGCASNLLAHEDLGHFEEAHHWNIQAKFYNEKFPLVYESDKTRDSLSWRSWCYFEAQVWKKDSSIVPFFWAFFFFLAFLSFLLGQCSMNDDHHTSIYLQLNDYNSILEQSMTLYECLRRCTGICNEPRVTCMKELWTVALPQIRCQLHDHAKQYDNDGACHNKRNGGKLHGNISRNGYGNAIIGRYGGCFEEGIWWVYDTGERCAVLERLAMVEGWECV